MSVIIRKLKAIRWSYIYHRNQRRYHDILPHVINSADTLRLIIECGLSVSRYGDGEVCQIEGYNIGFSDFSEDLKNRLIEVAKLPVKNHLVCIPPQIRTTKGMRSYAREMWQAIFAFEIKTWINLFNSKRIYGSSFISRYYMDFIQREENAKEIVDLWKRVWNGKDLLIVEGENSRLGVGNDLFDNARSIKRILCPAKNAYTSYDEIVNKTCEIYRGELILAALGPTATVLAYDLAKRDMQAIDIGHIDVEYEWYRRKAKHLMDIPTKAVNEVKGGLEVTNINSEEYTSQIVARVGVNGNV
jgi:glycosyltransferase